MEVAATPSPEQVATFTGAIYLDAHNAEAPVAAKVGDIVCGEGVTVNIPGGPGGPGPVGFGYRVAVLSQEARPGCGFDGAVITFFVGGRQASQIGIWRAGVTQIMALTAPPFAFVGGSLSSEIALPGQTLVPFIGNQPCGYASGSLPPTYSAFVYAAQQQAGCGVEGAEITFKLLDAQGNVIAVAREKGTWHAWDGSSPPQQLNLTMVPVGTPEVTVVSVGDAPAQSGKGQLRSVWMALAALGLAGVATGAELRRRVRI